MSELLVLAQLAGKRCALRASDVGSIIEAGAIAPIPCTPSHIVGITALRSRAMTVIDCRAAIGEDPDQFPCDDHLAVVEVEGHAYALRLDTVEDIANSQSDLTPVPGKSGDNWKRIAQGMIETDRGPALLIDIAQVIAGIEENHSKAA